MKFFFICILISIIFSIKLISQNDNFLFYKTTITPEKKDLFTKYLDSMSIMSSYQIEINKKAFSKDTMLLKYNDSTIYTFILQDTLLEKFDMLCLNYLVVETKKFVNWYAFDNFKRISLILIENGVTYKIENIGDDHFFYFFKHSENLSNCGNENDRITNKY